MSAENDDFGEVQWICYRFSFPDGRVKEFEIKLDAHSLSLVTQKSDTYPDWTRLEHHQCTNCPLHKEDHPYCPIAANLSGVIDYFKSDISFDEAELEVFTESRTYKKRERLQHAVASLIGIFMVTSGCPIMDKLRPLVKVHVPSSTLEETTYRAISMYLLAQYFLHRSGKKADWALTGLADIYKQVELVNAGFGKRLNSIKIKDASLNAVVNLNLYAQFTNIAIFEDELKDLENLFHPYLHPQASRK